MSVEWIPHSQHVRRTKISLMWQMSNSVQQFWGICPLAVISKERKKANSPTKRQEWNWKIHKSQSLTNDSDPNDAQGGNHSAPSWKGVAKENWYIT